MNDLLREFLLEADELIDSLFQDIAELEQKFQQGPARRELIGRIFRNAHTIKGTASAAELAVTTAIAHEFEALLDAVRMGRVTLDGLMIGLFVDAAAAIDESLRAAARAESLSLPVSLIDRLRHALRPGEERDGAEAERVLSLLPPDVARTLSQYEHQRLREAVMEGSNLFLITVDFNLEDFDESFRRMSAALTERGELISTLPGLEASAPDQMNFRIVHATVESASDLNERIGPFQPTDVATLVANEPEPQIPQQTRPEFDDEDVASSPVDRPAFSSSPVVRVDLRELDRLIMATHELMTDSLAALDLTLSMDLARRQRTELEIRASRIKRRFVDLEERLTELRMISLEQTLSRAARAGTIAARTLGKDVEIVFLGGDVRIDKSVADAISDPLLHIIRNAVSHGAEPLEQRLEKGKGERGKIVIEALAEGSRVRLRVTDDGRGIDPDRVAAVAVERGVIEHGVTLTKQQSLKLIFRPGFSTAESVSSVSGRGVGLDVVEKAVEQVGGELRVWSEAGAGTTFEMLLPTTLSLAPSLLVSAAGYRYAIDASHIVEAGYLTPDQIFESEGVEGVEWRGQKMPLVHLRTLLGHTRDETPVRRHHVVISHIAGQEQLELQSESDEPSGHAAVLVDNWQGHSEVLVRSLGRHAARWRGISGAADLRDGAFALVLDLPRLLEMQLNS
jgi:two-component system chemotaxis sensor kinase CheA